MRESFSLQHQDITERQWRWGLGLGSIVIAAFAWQGLALLLDNLMLPTFTSTMNALFRQVDTHEFWQALWISNQAAALGFLAAAIVGILIGLAMGRWRVVETIVDPYLQLLMAVPKAALIPVLIMMAGIGLFSRTLIVFSFAVGSIAINTRAGFQLVNRNWVEMARAFLATESQLWRKVVLPGALPGVVAGLRLGVIRSLAGMVAVELLLLAVGVGRLILEYEGTFHAADLYAVTLAIVIEAVALIQLLNSIERFVAVRMGRSQIA